MKIVQLILMPNDQKWQGAFLGLGSDGVTYELDKNGKWKAFIPNVDKG